MASTYLTRTPSSAGNRKTFTFSLWYKRSNISTNSYFVQNSSDGQFSTYLFINSLGDLRFFDYTSGGAYNFRLETNRLFRDVNAWYHIVVSFDSTQSTSTDRVKIYINGVQETSFSTETYPSQNYDSFWNNTNQFYIGSYRGVSDFNDGLMSHFHFIDGTAYDATAFGEFDANGVWKIKTSPSVTYGTNGFFILKDGNSVTDQSGNGNNFTVASGTLTNTEDCPSNVFATLNPLNKHPSRTLTFSNGNTTIEASDSNWQPTSGTIGVNTGKYYFEFSQFVSNQIFVGVMADDCNFNQNLPYQATGLITYFYSGRLTVDGTETESYFTAISSQTDVVGVALDMTAGTYGQVQFYHNGSATGSAVNLTSHFANKFVMPFAMCNGTGRKVSINTGNGYFGTTAVASAGTNASGIGIFEYDVPTGYTALCTKGLNGE